MAIDLELLKKEYDEALKSIETGFWIPKEGENLIRILPPSPREKVKLFYRKTFVHYGVEGLGLVFCLAANWGEKCPVCEFIGKLKGIESIEAVNLGKRLMAVERFLMNVVPLNEDMITIRQWLSPKSVRLELIRIILDKDWGDITDLRAGRNVIIERREKVGTRFVEYSVRPKPNITSIEIDENEIPSFDEILLAHHRSYDEIKFSMFGEGVAEGDEVKVYLERVIEKKKGREEEDNLNREKVQEEVKNAREIKKEEEKKGLSKEELLTAALKVLSAYKEE